MAPSDAERNAPPRRLTPLNLTQRSVTAILQSPEKLFGLFQDWEVSRERVRCGYIIGVEPKTIQQAV